MTTTTQYTDFDQDPNPFGAPEASSFGDTFHQLVIEASAADDPEVDAQMAWDCLAFAAAAFVRNSGGTEGIEVTRALYMMLAQSLFTRMVDIASGGEDSETYEG